jgi:hypothetical protein
MKRNSNLTFVLAGSLLLSMVCIAQEPASEKSRRDDLLARAERGDAAAQVKLGNAYLGRVIQTGVKITPSTSEAVRWFEAAAKQNNMEALLELGRGYEYGYLGEADGEKAVQYFRRAAELGNTDAVIELIHLYVEGGKGLEKNFDEAAQWAHCPKASSSTMQQCQSITIDDLPKPAQVLLQKLKCEPDPNDVTAIPLRDGSDLPYYEVCCHYGPHGPCDAVMIGEVKGQWKDLTDHFGLVGFNETCAGLIVLRDAHAGLHDLCLPTQCSKTVNNQCEPTNLEFNGIRYEPVRASSQNR